MLQYDEYILLLLIEQKSLYIFLFENWVSTILLVPDQVFFSPSFKFVLGVEFTFTTRKQIK